eukprot:749312-Hanusia_phi.AAC.2
MMMTRRGDGWEIGQEETRRHETTRQRKPERGIARWNRTAMKSGHEKSERYKQGKRDRLPAPLEAAEIFCAWQQTAIRSIKAINLLRFYTPSPFIQPEFNPPLLSLTFSDAASSAFRRAEQSHDRLAGLGGNLMGVFSSVYSLSLSAFARLLASPWRQSQILRVPRAEGRAVKVEARKIRRGRASHLQIGVPGRKK